MTDVRILLNRDDLARVRLHSLPDPFHEITLAVHRMPLAAADPALGGWARRTAMALGPAGREVLGLLNSTFVQTSPLGRRDHKTPRTFEEGIDDFHSVPPVQWMREIDDMAELGVRVDVVRSLAARLTGSQREAVTHLESAMRAFSRAAIAPHWPHIAVYAAAGHDAAATVMAKSGVEALLGNLHPSITWQAPVLTVSIGGGCPPGCVHRRLQSALPRRITWIADGRGIVFVPSIFFPTPTLRVPGPEEDEPVVITFPVVTDWHAFGVPDGAAVRSPLADLMGSTRALVLETLADGPQTTSGLARRLNVSVASASEHAAVLRASKLVSSVREGNRVIHHLSALGRALLWSTAQSTFAAPVGGRPGIGHHD